MAFIRVGIPLCVRCHENFSDNDECLHDALQVLFPDHRGGTGNWLVSASADGLVQVMNLQSGMDEDEAFQVSSAAFCKINELSQQCSQNFAHAVTWACMGA